MVCSLSKIIYDESPQSPGQWIEDILGVLWACSFAACLSQHFREGTAKKCIMFHN